MLSTKSRLLSLANVMVFLIRKGLQVSGAEIFQQFDAPFMLSAGRTQRWDGTATDLSFAARFESWLRQQCEKATPSALWRSRLPTLTFNETAKLYYVRMPALFRICAYERENECSLSECTHLHICKLYAAGFCTARDGRCSRGLHESGLANAALFRETGLYELTVDERMALVRASHPHVCADYAYGKCKNSNCTEMHCCNELILGVACRSDPCKKRHDLIAS